MTWWQFSKLLKIEQKYILNIKITFASPQLVAEALNRAVALYVGAGGVAGELVDRRRLPFTELVFLMGHKYDLQSLNLSLAFCWHIGQLPLHPRPLPLAPFIAEIMTKSRVLSYILNNFREFVLGYLAFRLLLSDDSMRVLIFRLIFLMVTATLNLTFSS